MEDISNYFLALQPETLASELPSVPQSDQNATRPVLPYFPGDPFPPQENLNPPDDVLFTFTFDIPLSLDRTPFSLTDGLATDMSWFPDFEEDLLRGWGATAPTVPLTSFPYYDQNNINHLPHDPRPRGALHSQPTPHVFGIDPPTQLPPLPEFPCSEAGGIPTSHPFPTKAPNFPSPPSGPFASPDYLSPPSSCSTSSSSPSSSGSSSTSPPPDPLLGKRRRDNSVDDHAAPSSRTFHCKWKDCNKMISYVPEGPMGGLPSVLRHHLQQHYPGAQRQATVSCLWESCNKTTSRDNLRKHIMTHLPDFHHRCPGCDSSHGRSDRLLAHMKKCERYLNSHGCPPAAKRVK